MAVFQLLRIHGDLSKEKFRNWILSLVSLHMSYIRKMLQEHRKNTIFIEWVFMYICHKHNFNIKQHLHLVFGEIVYLYELESMKKPLWNWSKLSLFCFCALESRWSCCRAQWLKPKLAPEIQVSGLASINTTFSQKAQEHDTSVNLCNSQQQQLSLIFTFLPLEVSKRPIFA